MIFKSDSSAAELNGFLDSGSRLEGDLQFEASFRIDGKFVGKVVSEGSLVVGDEGEIEGEIHVAEVLLSGTVRGEVHASRRVQLAPSARVFADLFTPSLVIEDGALFEGRCAMKKRDDTPREDPGPKLVSTLPTAKEGGA